jgi:hypothetical protein
MLTMSEDGFTCTSWHSFAAAQMVHQFWFNITDESVVQHAFFDFETVLLCCGQW